tara:strand:+ start:358 stop:1083 length:726 start_codon:yes stop_codon:yes gene_type:complete
MNNKLHIGIMAAGKGSRMESNLPKVLHQLNDKALIDYVLKTASKLNPKSITMIVGFKKDMVINHTKKSNIDYVHQEEQLGTGHAVLQLADKLEHKSGHLLILSGDVPNVKSSSLKPIVEHHINNDHNATVITAIVNDSSGYGRIVRDPANNFIKIVEQKDCNSVENLIKEINSGIFIFKISNLFKELRNIKSNNAQNEYYLTDVMELIGEKLPVHAKKINDSTEVLGINTINQLNELENEN